MTKPILSSWTIWFGVLQVLTGVVGIISGKLDGGTGTGLITTGLGTIALRFKTSQPIVDTFQ